MLYFFFLLQVKIKNKREDINPTHTGWKRVCRELVVNHDCFLCPTQFFIKRAIHAPPSLPINQSINKGLIFRVKSPFLTLSKLKKDWSNHPSEYSPSLMHFPKITRLYHIWKDLDFNDYIWSRFDRNRRTTSSAWASGIDW